MANPRAERLGEISLILIGFTIPLSNVLCTGVFPALAVVSWLMLCGWRDVPKLLRENHVALLCVVLFAWLGVAAIYGGGSEAFGIWKKYSRARADHYLHGPCLHPAQSHASRDRPRHRPHARYANQLHASGGNVADKTWPSRAFEYVDAWRLAGVAVLLSGPLRMENKIIGVLFFSGLGCGEPLFSGEFVHGNCCCLLPWDCCSDAKPFHGQNSSGRYWGWHR